MTHEERVRELEAIDRELRRLQKWAWVAMGLAVLSLVLRVVSLFL